MPDNGGIALPQHIQNFVSEIDGRLSAAGETLPQAIAERELYFRVSLLGACNLDCPFCHNEGGPREWKLGVKFAVEAMRKAYEVGFRRVQFTGGEPLLHPEVVRFVSEARLIFDAVGITTNGVFLEGKIDRLIQAGITNIHVSLQPEIVRDPDTDGNWKMPNWLASVLEVASEGKFKLRLNLPVPADEIRRVMEFLADASVSNCDVRVFSLLPDESPKPESYDYEKLEMLVQQENERRKAMGSPARLFFRGYRAPTGIRCAGCEAYDRCREQSHSLRLGADRVFRPCLATRRWDLSADGPNLLQTMKVATLLAIDYTWH